MIRVSEGHSLRSYSLKNCVGKFNLQLKCRDHLYS